MEELGDFLRSRRSRLTPQDAGVQTFGERRRVPGLRREELAQLAGVSVAYYTRLEQGLSRNASDAVLDALARALRLDDDETAHLHVLAAPRRSPRPRPRPDRVRPAVLTMLGALGDAPAVLINYRNDVLGWNSMGHALIAGHLRYCAPDHAEDRPNLIWHIFCDPHVRDLYADWKTKAEDAVNYLRMVSGTHHDDPRLASLIGELSVASPEFARLWARHAVRQCQSGLRGFRHPLVGPLTLNEEVMELLNDGGQRLIVFSAESGSASDAGLRLLADLTAESRRAQADRAQVKQAAAAEAANCLPAPAPEPSLADGEAAAVSRSCGESCGGWRRGREHR